ncbi:MAG: hypothetical protein ACPIOQ_28615, partial [Promethearchaeia archaeon]
LHSPCLPAICDDADRMGAGTPSSCAVPRICRVETSQLPRRTASKSVNKSQEPWCDVHDGFVADASPNSSVGAATGRDSLQAHLHRVVDA